MCGRYAFTAEDNDELLEIVREVERQGSTVKTGEIFPTNPAPVLVSSEGRILPRAFTWGLPGFKGKGVIINARAETAEEKRTFRDGLFARRCVIPSAGFYEWDSHKQKYLFQLGGDPTLFMAGMYNLYEGQPRFVIFTTAANPSMEDIHSRMPVIVPRGAVQDWIQDTNSAIKLLHAVPPLLERAAV